uniref:Uncharacterized protein n=1 Tax=Mycena chlorophos TaxID=658473 RepID=A0ABQ0M8Z1_MYCCL|nr:predicted protein [Mycena chlorophos]
MASGSKGAAAPSLSPNPSGATVQRRISTTEVISAFIRSKTISRKSKSNRAQIVWPPPSWKLEDTVNHGMGASATDAPRNSERAAEHEESEHDSELEADNKDEHEEEALPEPQELAQQIGDLIETLPPIPEEPSSAEVPPVDPNGPPLSPAVANNPQLVQLLASERAMGGSISRNRESVWSKLEKLKERHGGRSGARSDKKEGEGGERDREDGGVMVYAPLVPTPDSEVEIADSEVLEYLDEAPPTSEQSKPAEETAKPPPSPTPAPAVGSQAPNAQSKAAPVSAPEKKPATPGVKPSPSRVQVKPRKPGQRVHWVPSRTKMSLQVMWWGYRLYLPPAVMKKLDDTHLSAAKRGAMVMAALKYMLARVPVMVLPPEVRPAVMLLKRLSPYLAYIGVFVSWSWHAIQERDKGYGCVLTATWLMPVALLPSTLHLKDYLRPGEVLPPRKAASGADEGAPKDKKDGAEAPKVGSPDAKAGPSTAKPPNAKPMAGTQSKATPAPAKGKGKVVANK